MYFVRFPASVAAPTFLVFLLLCVALSGCKGERSTEVSPASVSSMDVTKTLAASCETNEYQSCFDLGERYRTANGVGEDFKQANELFSKACEGGFARSCTSLGLSYLRGRGVDKDSKRAISLFMKSCESGWAWGCHPLSSNALPRYDTPKPSHSHSSS
jgi:TPR repeat protein